MQESTRVAAWVYRPEGRKWRGWEVARWDDPPDRVLRGPSAVWSAYRLDDVTFVSGVTRPHVGVLAVAVGTPVSPLVHEDIREWTGFVFDARKGTDAFWTVPEGEEAVRLTGADRVWLRPDGRAYLTGPRTG